MKKEKPEKTQNETSRPLTQEELLRWWPFTRLELHRFPKQNKQPKYPEAEEALI